MHENEVSGLSRIFVAHLCVERCKSRLDLQLSAPCAAKELLLRLPSRALAALLETTIGKHRSCGKGKKRNKAIAAVETGSVASDSCCWWDRHHHPHLLQQQHGKSYTHSPLQSLKRRGMIRVCCCFRFTPISKTPF